MWQLLSQQAEDRPCLNQRKKAASKESKRGKGVQHGGNRWDGWALYSS
jgi:hypothetical protein